MEIICESCGSTLNIPDQKIPRGQKVRTSCPKCKAKLTFGAKPPSKGEETRREEKEKSPHYEYGAEDSDLDSYEEGIKLAFILERNPAAREKLKNASEGLGYKSVFAEDSRSAISKMRFHHFDLIVLSEDFDDTAMEQSAILQHLNRLSMSVRRRVFLVLVGKSFHAMDAMAAFSMSANLVLNEKDIDRSEIMLRKTIAEHQSFYKIFRDTHREIKGM
jgi:CheY-like chemotaxis protein